MTRKWYGSLQNRLEENRMYCENIEVGTGMTEYFYSDRKPYEVTEVIDQKHIKVRGMDHRNVGGAYSNEWELTSNENNPTRLITRRGNVWYWTTEITSDLLDDDSIDTQLFLAFNNVDREVLREKGKVTRYHKANVSFGTAQYYYDYEF